MVEVVEQKNFFISTFNFLRHSTSPDFFFYPGEHFLRIEIQVSSYYPRWSKVLGHLTVPFDFSRRVALYPPLYLTKFGHVRMLGRLFGFRVYFQRTPKWISTEHTTAPAVISTLAAKFSKKWILLGEPRRLARRTPPNSQSQQTRGPTLDASCGRDPFETPCAAIRAHETPIEVKK